MNSKASLKRNTITIAPGGNGKSIQDAIDAISAQGGGVVIVPKGIWHSGTIWLRSHVELHLEKDAVIKASTEEVDYNPNDAFPENFCSPGEEWSGGHLILGYKVEDVAITGEGTIDGSGPDFFGDCDFDSFWPCYKYGLKLHPLNRTWFRPGPMVAFFLCKDISLEGISLNNTPSWTCHVRCSKGLVVKNVSIYADRTIANSDGFSIDCTQDVLIENCKIKTGDDGFAIRASCQHHAKENPCERIHIKNCDIWSCCLAFRFGIGSGDIRDVVVEDTRIHEAGDAAFAFTPAWLVGERNCHIQNISFKNCTAADCVRPALGTLVENSCISNINFQDCSFSTLLPSFFDKGCSVSFKRCVRNTIYAFKVRHRMMWNERTVRAEKGLFLTGGVDPAVATTDCRPKPPGTQGVLLLAFDDRNFGDWEKALPLFKEYNAHATFFVSGDFDSAAVGTAKRLIADGHSIGFHGRTHANVPEMMEDLGAEGWLKHEIQTPQRQTDVSYIPVHSFGYPNNRHTEETDKYLLTHFERLRVGIPGIRPYDPEGKLAKDSLAPLVSDDRLFFSAKELPTKRVLGGIVLGDAYHTEIDEILACVRRAAERKEVILFTSHGISEDATHINMKTAWLKKILEEAQKGDMLILGFDELP